LTSGGGALQAAFGEGSTFGEGSLLTEDVDWIPSEGGFQTSSAEGELLRGLKLRPGMIGLGYYSDRWGG